MHYYGTRLSENISRREPEGYLLCLNVPVARSGTQEYRPDELSLPPGEALVPVYRPEEEVFSPQAVASFEGMPVTNNHPPEGVDIRNIRALQKGHAHNVRRGSGKEKDLLLADLIITDPGLIEAILAGKREISCGYTYELCEENGRYIQRNIRGNHVAVVDAGRAGKRVSIRDAHPVRISGSGASRAAGTAAVNKTNNERRTNNMKKTLSKVLARMAKDGDIETVAEILEEMISEPSETAEGEASTTAGGNFAETENAVMAEAPAVVPETETAADEATLDDVLSRLDRIIALLTPETVDEMPAEQVSEIVEEVLESAAEAPAGTLEATVSEMVEEILEPAVSEILAEETGTEGDEDPEQEVLCSADALKAALTAVRPALAKMPKRQRRQVCADIAGRLKGRQRPAADSRVYAALASARKKPAVDAGELGRRIMASRNANLRR